MKLRHCFPIALLAACCSFAVPSVSAKTFDTASADRSRLSLTVYEQGQTLVRDARHVQTGSGRFNLVVHDVSEQIQSETLMLESNSRLRLSGATFNSSLLTPENLMKAYIGKDVTLIRTNPATGQEIQRRAKLLSMSGGAIVQVDGHIETVSTDRIVFDKVPSGLYPSPVLMLDLQGGSGGSQHVVFDYLTGGLSWNADYTAVIESGDRSMSLASWAVIGNQSGVDYRDATVQLMAGRQNQVYRHMPMMAMMKASRAATENMMVNDTASEASFADYHLYTLPEKVNVLNSQTARYRLLSSDRVKVVKEYIVNGNAWAYQSSQGGASEPVHAGIWLNFSNTKHDGLGMPLPAGGIRFYQEDSSGNRQLIGAGNIQHTPVDGKVRLALGEAFDVMMVRKQTSFKQHVLEKGQEKIRQTVTGWELTLANAENHAVTVKVVEPMPGNSRILDENQTHRTEDGTVVWAVTVPAHGKTVLRYRVQVN